MATVKYTERGGYDREVAVRMVTRRSSWGVEAKAGCCGFYTLGGRTTWHICDRPGKAVAVLQDGSAYVVCGLHVGNAKRCRRMYADTAIALLSLDGEQTHAWNYDGLVEVEG